MQKPIEHLTDSQGTTVLGWVASGILYARFERTISAALAARFAERWSSHVGDATSIVYFADSSLVLGYELAALTKIFDAVASKRARLRQVVVCPWGGGLGAKAASSRVIEGLEHTTSGSDFDARLIAAAPLAKGEARRTARRREGAENSHAATLYTYMFDLSRFEQGRFTATRLEHMTRGPLDCWVCVARDDADALRLARRAALTEWARPTERRPEEFAVEFLDVDPVSGAPRF